MSRAAHILIALSSLLLLIACGRGGKMRRQLASLQARNQDGITKNLVSRLESFY